MRIIRVSFDCGGFRMKPKGKGHSGKLDDQVFEECHGTETDRDVVRKNRERRRSKKASVKLAQGTDWAEAPYLDYLNAVDDVLETRRGSTSTQEELEAIDDSQTQGLSPEECVDFLMGEVNLRVV